MMEYKGYVGTFQYYPDEEVFHGRVEGIGDVVSFQGRSVDELKLAFRESVEDYLAFCQESGGEPEKPFSGTMVVRADADLHRRAFNAARAAGTTLNAFLVDTIRATLADPADKPPGGQELLDPKRQSSRPATRSR